MPLLTVPFRCVIFSNPMPSWSNISWRLGGLSSATQYNLLHLNYTSHSTQGSSSASACLSCLEGVHTYPIYVSRPFLRTPSSKLVFNFGFETILKEALRRPLSRPTPWKIKLQYSFILRQSSRWFLKIQTFSYFQRDLENF